MRIFSILAATFCTLFWGIPVFSADSGAPMVTVGRVGLIGGSYDIDISARATDGVSGAPLAAVAEDDSSGTYGAHTGLYVGVDDLFFDVALELLTGLESLGDDLDRTDVLATVGYFVGQNVSVFAGYRKGFQGDGFFDDEALDESGFYAGIGVRGFSVGDINMFASAAYNFSSVEGGSLNESTDIDYDGVSLKLGGAHSKWPSHSVQLRYQRFDGDDSVSEDLNLDGTPDRIDAELTETYLQLLYSYAIPF